MSTEELVDLSREHSQPNSNAQLWAVPNADHVQSYKTGPVAYLDHVLTFFDKSLGKK